MAEGDKKKNKRDTKNKAAHIKNGDSQNGGFEDDTFGDEGFRQEGGTTHGTRRHRAQTLIIVGVIVLGVTGLAASFLLRDAATPAPNRVTPGATLFVTVRPTRTPSPPATPQPAPTFASIDIQSADTPRQMLREITLAEGQVGTNTSGKNTGLYSYDGRWLATLNAQGTALKITGGSDDSAKLFDLPGLADVNAQVYAWSPDNTALLLTAGLTSTAAQARQILLVGWDAATQVQYHVVIPISTTLDALTLGSTSKDTPDDIARTALAYWSPDGSRLAVIADAVLDDPPYNEDGSPRFRKLIRLFDRAGNSLGQFETSSDCCYWTPRNELMWWDARDPNAREYVFHILAATESISNTADVAQSAREVRVPLQYAPGGLWLISAGPFSNESGGVTQLLAVELGTPHKLVKVDFDNRRVEPLLDRLDHVSAAFTSPDIPITALHFTRVGADNTLWFYDWAMAEMVAGGQVQQLGSWDADLRGFTSLSAGPSAGTAQIELLDAPSKDPQIVYSSPPQNLRAETSALRPWVVNSTGIGIPSSLIDANQISPNGLWRAKLNLTANISISRLLPQWPSDLWKILPPDAPVSELVMTSLDKPSLTFTQVFTLANGIPAFWRWSPASTAIAITSQNSMAKPQSMLVLQMPASETKPAESTQFDIADQTVSPVPPYPIWSQDGTSLLISSGENWHVLNAAGVEKQKFARELGDSFLLHLSGQLLLLTQSNVLQTVDLRDAEFARRTVYTWKTEALPHGILGINADGSEAIIFEADPSDNTKTVIERVSFETGTATPILQFDGAPQHQPFAAGPSNQPILGMSLHDGSRVLDEHIWFYNWDTGTLYDYNRPAKLLGWDAASKSFLLARRSADGFQVEAMQPLIQ